VQTATTKDPLRGDQGSRSVGPTTTTRDDLVSGDAPTERSTSQQCRRGSPRRRKLEIPRARGEIRPAYEGYKRGQQIAAIPNNAGSILAAIVWKPTFSYTTTEMTTAIEPVVNAYTNTIRSAEEPLCTLITNEREHRAWQSGDAILRSEEMTTAIEPVVNAHINNESKDRLLPAPQEWIFMN
jgi:hypothetical protein